ncbi:MAG: MGMT family protein [Gammaproteobacteria bacterium]|nr:MGMT family protein [Gammaproteobacteria bacterium]
MVEPTPDERIWQVVASIPYARVASYGQVAELAGLPASARRVGRSLAGLPADSRLPWHRVINAAGRVSLPGAAGERQRQRLREEGVAFTDGRVDLERYGWVP